MKLHSNFHFIFIIFLLEIVKPLDNNITLELKNERDCSYLPLQKELEIKTNEYNNTDVIIDIEGDVFLKSEDDINEIELECHLNKNKKYCKKKDGKERPGTYRLFIPSPIQKQSFNITSNGKNTIKIYETESKVDVLASSNYYIDYNNIKNKIIEIIFSSEPDDDNIKVMHDEKEIECTLKRTVMGCKIDNNTLGYDIENPNKNKEYELKIVDLCNTELYSFKVNVKNSSAVSNTTDTTRPKEEQNNKKIGKGEIIFIIFSALLFLSFVSFLVYTIISSKKQKLLEANKSESNIM